MRADYYVGDTMDLDSRYPAAGAALERLHFHRKVGEWPARTKCKLHAHVLVPCTAELGRAQTVRPASITWKDLDERVHKPSAQRRRATSPRNASRYQAACDYRH